MNSTRRVSLLLLAILAALLPACDTGASHFSPSSQDTVVTDNLQGSSGRNGLAAEGSGQPEGVGRRGGQDFYIRNGSATRLYQRQRFAQGYWYDRNKRLLAPDGEIVHLNEREMITFAGERIPIPPSVNFP